RKILIFVTFPTRSILTTRPSAGETIAWGSAGIRLSGFRKKNATNAVNSNNKTAAIGQCNQKLTAVAAAKGMRKRKASFTIIQKESVKPPGAARHPSFKRRGICLSNGAGGFYECWCVSSLRYL